MKVKSLWTRMAILVSSASDLFDRAARSFADRNRAVTEFDAVLRENLHGVRFPRAGTAEHRDLVGRLEAELDDPLDDAAGDEVGTRVRNDVGDDGNLLHALLREDELGEPLGLADARVAAERRVVRRLSAVLLDRVERRERPAARSDDEP